MSDGKIMSEEVIIGRRYTVVIPKSIREKIGLKEGQKVFVREQAGRIVIEPLPTDPYKTLSAVLGDLKYVEEKHEKVAEGWLKKTAGRLAQRKKLEGKADKVLASMFGADRKHPVKYTQKEHQEFVADKH